MAQRIFMKWTEIIDKEREKPYYKKLKTKIDEAYATQTVFPKQEDIFNAFKLTPFEKIKIVILGQDPYHGDNQAMGLAFSTPKEIKNPPSMVNIFKEIREDIGVDSVASDGDLSIWAGQGVLLLNTILTVEKANPKSHENYGWEQFTDTIIKTISDQKEHVVFLLWGAPAIKKSTLIDSTKHLILTAPHPSPLSSYRGFFGCKHFSKANGYLTLHEKEPIAW